MRLRPIALLGCSLLGCIAPSPHDSGAAPRENMIAGWDFSQYVGDGFASIDGTTLTNTLDANYSDLDPSFGAGAESAVFGRMHLDGRFGSTKASLETADAPFVPSSVAARSGSLASNLGAPGGVDFDCFSVLREEGQLLTNPIATTARARSVVVFEADLGSLRETGRDWSLSFAGRTNRGAAPVAIEFSTDGTSFASFGAVTLSEIDSPFHVKLGSPPSSKAYVRLGFDPAERRQQLFLDNLAIHATLSGPARPPPSPQLCPPPST